MKKKNQRPGSLGTLADVLPKLCVELSINEKINEMALLALWPAQVTLLAGPEIAAQTRAVKLKKQGMQTVLMVKVAHATLSSEMAFYLPALKDGLNRFTPQTGITVDRIQLLVGSVK